MFCATKSNFLSIWKAKYSETITLKASPTYCPHIVTRNTCFKKHWTALKIFLSCISSVLSVNNAFSPSGFSWDCYRRHFYLLSALDYFSFHYKGTPGAPSLDANIQAVKYPEGQRTVSNLVIGNCWCQSQVEREQAVQRKPANFTFFFRNLCWSLATLHFIKLCVI